VNGIHEVGGSIPPGSTISRILRQALQRLFRRKSEAPATLAVRRLLDAPIVHAAMLPEGERDNINGPSLIRAPEWLPERLGEFYLYFGHHAGRCIKLAYADDLRGPWTVYAPGTLQLADVAACHDHIASPDVHVDDGRRQIVMLFHGVVRGSHEQKSFLARSTDGIRFVAEPEAIGDFYLRTVRWRDRWIGVSKGGVAYVAESYSGPYARLPRPLFPMRDPWGNAPGDIRHVALRVVDDRLEVFHTRIGDAPERICRAFVDLTAPIEMWSAANAELVLAPEREWEGAGLPVKSSAAGAARGREHALRDPALFALDGTTCLLYSAAGETSLGIAELVEPGHTAPDRPSG
jgi:hypothetical protein